MKSLWTTTVTARPFSLVPPAQERRTSCTPETMYEYHRRLEDWTVCQSCGRQGYGTKRLPDGKLVCDTSEPKSGALMSCPIGPVNPCVPLARPLNSLNTWNQLSRFSWGASVFDERYGKFILWDTWNPEKGRPYFSEEAPFLRAGLNQPCGP